MIIIEEKYKVFRVYIEQSFDYFWYEWKWFKRVTKFNRYVSDEKKVKYILAKTEEESINIYKARYRTEYDYPLEYLWNWNGIDITDRISDIPNWKHEVLAYEVHPTLDKLRKELRAEELFMYAKQEMYPVEVLIK